MSSPARLSRFNTYSLRSSSPDLPSLSEILRKSPRRPPPLRSGSNAAAVPATARSTFTSAADILREAPEIDIDTEQITHSPPRKAKPARKPRAKIPQRKDALGMANALPEVELSPKRFRPKTKKTPPENNAEAGQTSLPKGRVTKATAKDKSKAEKKANDVSEHFVAPDKKEQAEKQNAEQRFGSQIQLQQERELALARRIDWTPPRANSATIILDSESDNRELLSSTEKPVKPKEVFGKLFDEFAHKSENTGLEAGSRVSLETSEIVADVLKKRKRLDHASASDSKHGKQNAQSPGHSPVKLPAAKKKARTITELATAPYAAVPEIPDVDLLAPGNKESLLRYFDADGNVTALVEHQSIVMDRNSEKPKKKPAKSRKSKKGDSSEQPILLSPSSALKQSTTQDFVFGTSSQLVLEDSPRTLRNLQAALQASLQEDDPFANSPITAAEKQKGLWHAGARDADGEMLEAETITLIDDEEVVNVREIHEENTPVQAELLDVGNICSSSPPTASGRTKTKLNTSQAQDQVPSSAATIARPKYELFTDAQLAKQVRAYGFKPIKRRQAMVALLDQCWVSQHPSSSIAHPNLMTTASISTHAAQSSLNENTTTDTAVVPAEKLYEGPKKVEENVNNTAISPTRGRGRPRKDGGTAAVKDKSASPRGRGRPRKDGGIIVVRDPTASPPRGRGRPRKDGAIGVIRDATASPPRGRGRPRKDGGISVIRDATASPPRGRGRPRKDGGISVVRDATASPPRGRGRPRKDGGNSVVRDATASPPRGRGRPRKDVGISDVEVTTASPSRGRGRPRKSSITASECSLGPFANQRRTPTPMRRKDLEHKEIEIADSEDDDSLSLSPRSMADVVFSSPPAVDLSISEVGETSLNLTPTEQEANLFTQITKAVTSAPRSTDPNNPSWHEKMLLYDPIVLEELAAWLNSGELTRVGYDGEVSPNEVKNWCESKSVICLWKANTRGKERKRY